MTKGFLPQLILSSALLIPLSFSNNLAATTALFEMSLEDLLDVTVQTRKHDESYRSVPKSFDVVTKGELKAKQINSVYELTEFIPNVSLRKNFGRQLLRPSARGISNITAEPVIGMLFDGQDIGGLSRTLPLYDMERVEFMKGSEVAFYGRSTFAGAINFVPIKPSENSYHEFGITFAQQDEIDTHILSNNKITNDFYVLIGARHYEKGNDFDNSLGDLNGGYGSEKSQSVSISSLWKPVEKLEFYLRLSSQKNSDGHMPVYLQSSDHNNCFLDTFAQYYCGELHTPEKVGYNFNELFELSSNTDNDIKTFKATWTEENYNLQFVFNRSDSTINEGFDGDFFEAPLAFNKAYKRFNFRNYEFTADIDINENNRLLLGSSYFERDLIRTSSIYFTRPGGTIPSVGNDQFDYVNNQSIYGSYVATFFDNFEASVDLRYSVDEISYREIDTNETRSNKDEWFTLSPQFTISKKFNKSSSTVYLSLSQSQKPGGFNSTLESLNYSDPSEKAKIIEDFLTYDEEKLRSHTLGLRTDLLENRAWIDTSVFFYDWKDLQLTQSLLYESPTGPNRTTSILNGGKAHTWGGEFEFNWEANDSISVELGIGYAKTKLIDSATLAQEELTGDGSIDGHETPNWPTFNGHIVLNYKRNITQALQFFSSASLTYEDERFVAEHNLAILEDTEKVNLSIGIRKENWNLSLWCKQANKDNALESANRFRDFSNFRRGFGLSLPERRQVGITFSIQG